MALFFGGEVKHAGKALELHLTKAEDFGEEFTPELREREDRLRAEIEKQAKS